MSLLALLGSAAAMLGLLAVLISPTRPSPGLSNDQTLRVLLSYRLGASDFESQHVFPSLELTPLNEPLSLKSGPDAQHLSLALSALPQRPLRFTVQNGSIVAAVDGQVYPLGSVVLLQAVLPETAGIIRYRITSTTRGTPPANPEYPGRLWLRAFNTGLLMVNEVGMEEYLKRVVPSEMPPFFHPQALAAQAVAARTYAYSRMAAGPENNFWKQFGADVDDSVSEQLYNATPTHPATDAAIAASRGQILTYGGQPIQAYFFSTSPGSTAPLEEVWPDRNPQPYLKAQAQASPVPGAIQGEAAALAFFKNWNRQGYYDGESSLFRWKVSLSRGELEAILSKTLPAIAKASPEFVETPEGALSPNTPDFKLGTLQKLIVQGRTLGGFVTGLEVQTSSGRYLVRRESNIRSLIRPTKALTGGPDIGLERSNGTQSLNFPTLPSAAFALEEERDGNGGLQRVTFWGGGYGHGVGMSQFGANYLGKMGRSYPQILTHFYPGSSLTSLPSIPALNVPR